MDTFKISFKITLLSRTLDDLNVFFFFFVFTQVLDEQKLQQVDSLWKEFETPEKANKM